MLIPFLTNGGSNLNQLFQFKSYTESAINVLNSGKILISSSNSNGGYFSIFDFEPNSEDNIPKMKSIIACGDFPKEKRGRYFYFSIEKAIRLGLNIPAGHITSRYSADPKEEEYAGAIFTGVEIYSFSGLNPEWDEFISTMNSSFEPHIRTRSMSSLEEVPKIFTRKMHLITASPTQKLIMSSVVEKVVVAEIEKKKEKELH